jgi:hypothetical protein
MNKAAIPANASCLKNSAILPTIVVGLGFSFLLKKFFSFS